MSLIDEVEARLKTIFTRVYPVKRSPMLYRVEGHLVNIRTAAEKSGDKYWFDVTPSLYENMEVEYFAYACGSGRNVYVFPTRDLVALLEGASLGGQKQVPHFTIFLGQDELEPAGQAWRRHNIGSYLNNFALIT